MSPLDELELEGGAMSTIRRVRALRHVGGAWGLKEESSLLRLGYFGFWLFLRAQWVLSTLGDLGMLVNLFTTVGIKFLIISRRLVKDKAF